MRISRILIGAVAAATVLAGAPWGQAAETVQVLAGADLVNTTTPEISNTVIRRQIVDLPLNGRNPIELIRLQAGVVGLPTRTNTTINGGRPSGARGRRCR